MNYEVLSIDRLEEHEKLIKENEYLRRNRDKAIEYIEELYEMAKEQDSDNVNLIDRLEFILKVLKGENNDA